LTPECGSIRGISRIVMYSRERMNIVIASGKGGTGKTTVAVSLAYTVSRLGQPVRLLDCDVEAPNDHLFVKPNFTDTRDIEVLKPAWDQSRCIGCGKCVDACNFNAIAKLKEDILIFPELCRGCGACSYVCPSDALAELKTPIGRIQIDPDHPRFFFAHGVLNIGEILAPTVIRGVKSHIVDSAINILDAAPGTACPVASAFEGAHVAVLVTEPTPFGLYDLKLAAAMTLELGIPTGIVVNRSGSSDDLISEYAKEIGVPIIGRIPFSRSYAESYSSGNVLVNGFQELEDTFIGIFERLKKLTVQTVPSPPPAEQPFTVEFDESVAEDTTSERQTNTAREVVIVSGKGGTGKTTVAAAFAHLQENGALADTDVDASDLHLLLNPRIREIHIFTGGHLAVVDSAACTGCGMCADACRFDAFRFDGAANDVTGTTYRVDPVTCEGCGHCVTVCPEHAIETEPRFIGHWYDSSTDFGPFSHARLGTGEENSGKLVTEVRARAAELARKFGKTRILSDGPPGTGCPVIASVTGAGLVLIVTEPTVSGVHDMTRVLDLCSRFGNDALVIINKADLNPEQASRIEKIAVAKDSRVIARIPFDPAVHRALMAGRTVIHDSDSPAGSSLRDAWEEVKTALKDEKVRKLTNEKSTSPQQATGYVGS
jgi:MinD superfamily P-loop ATPase